MCYGVDERCTGKNSGGPCFINLAPDEPMFKKILKEMENPLATQIIKLCKGYKTNSYSLVQASSYIHKYIGQPFIKTICLKYNKELIYKFPTIINLKYEPINKPKNRYSEMLQRAKQRMMIGNYRRRE